MEKSGWNNKNKNKNSPEDKQTKLEREREYKHFLSWTTWKEYGRDVEMK